MIDCRIFRWSAIRRALISQSRVKPVRVSSSGRGCKQRLIIRWARSRPNTNQQPRNSAERTALSKSFGATTAAEESIPKSLLSPARRSSSARFDFESSASIAPVNTHRYPVNMRHTLITARARARRIPIVNMTVQKKKERETIPGRQAMHVASRQMGRCIRNQRPISERAKFESLISRCDATRRHYSRKMTLIYSCRLVM